MLKQFRPVHLWISCDCAPYCPLQRINQRSDAQCERLRKKQEAALKQYRGAIEVADFAKTLKIQVHWELAERCEAWKLDDIGDFIARHDLKKVTCHGCTVGLKTRDGKLALCKGWSVATQNAELLRHLDLKCQ